MTTELMPGALVITIFWIGFVSAISFMESWLKFRAPGITLPVALGIGRLIFKGLNRVEWVLFFLTTLFVIKDLTSFKYAYIGLMVAFFMLILQTFWLLPSMGKRTDKIIQNEENVPPSKKHFWYVGFELVKLISLVAFILLF